MRKLMMKKGGIRLMVKLLTVLSVVFFVGGTAVAQDQTVSTNAQTEADSAEAAAAVSGTSEGSALAAIGPLFVVGFTGAVVAATAIATSAFEGGKTATTHVP
jgi:uncharacterized protein (UPF0333 family)